MKKLFFYLLYVLALLLTIAHMEKISNQLRLIAVKEVRPSALYILISFLYPIMLGMLLALPEFLCKLRSKGKIIVNWMKVFVVVLPTLCLNLWRAFDFVVPIPFNVPYIRLLLNSSHIGIILGYTLLTVISKENIDSDKFKTTG